jgi:hypothetical protein
MQKANIFWSGRARWPQKVAQSLARDMTTPKVAVILFLAQSVTVLTLHVTK